MIRTTRIRTLAIVLLTLSASARAELGGDANSVQADQSGMKATQQVTDTAHYTLHELQLPSGLQVREYAAGGTVFAVAWEGPELPDLQRLLGPYFPRYSDAALQRAGRGSLSIRLPDLVVQSGGHMRSFSGRAYLPDHMPEGVTPEGIQ